MNRNEKKQQASYIKEAAITKSLIGDLQDALISHEQEAGGRNKHGHWGYNGDLKHANNELAIILGFLTGNDNLADNGIQAYNR